MRLLCYVDTNQKVVGVENKNNSNSDNQNSKEKNEGGDNDKGGPTDVSNTASPLSVGM